MKSVRIGARTIRSTRFLFHPIPIPTATYSTSPHFNRYRYPSSSTTSNHVLLPSHSKPFSSESLSPSGSSPSTLPAPASPSSPPYHAVVSTFDLLSIGLGPSSSHTVGPMRAAKIFVQDLKRLGLLDRVGSLKVGLFGSLAATGKGHMSPQALMMGFEGEDVQTLSPHLIPTRYSTIQSSKKLCLNGTHSIPFDLENDLTFHYDKILPQHPNGMVFSVFEKKKDSDEEEKPTREGDVVVEKKKIGGGDLLAVNRYFSVGGGFVVNEETEIGIGVEVNIEPEQQRDEEGEASDKAKGKGRGGENLFYKEIDKSIADEGRKSMIQNAPPTSTSASSPSSAAKGSEAEVLGAVVGEGAEGGIEVESSVEAGGEISPISHQHQYQKEDGTKGKNENEKSSSTSSEGGVENQESQSHYPLLFHNGDSLLQLSKEHNLTIAQIVWNNERHYFSDLEIRRKIARIWRTMDDSIRSGVQSNEEYLPGEMKVKRRAKGLYQRLMRGFYPGSYATTILTTPSDSRSLPSSSSHHQSQNNQEECLPSPTGGGGIIEDKGMTAFGDVDGGGVGNSSGGDGSVSVRGEGRRGDEGNILRGSWKHFLKPVVPRRTVFPAMDFLSCYAIAVNEVNASGGRVVTAPTNGAAGVIPSVLKYVVEFISEDVERDICTFLLTASAIGMLYKRGATISAAEGGCMAEVGVACSMAAGGFAACMGASPEVIEQAAEIAIEHNLGLTCDPIDGMVQVPCIERNALGAVKAVTAAQLALAGGDGRHSVSLDEAIAAMRVTARDMSHSYKETSRSGLATSVKARIPVAVPDC